MLLNDLIDELLSQLPIPPLSEKAILEVQNAIKKKVSPLPANYELYARYVKQYALLAETLDKILGESIGVGGYVGFIFTRCGIVPGGDMKLAVLVPLMPNDKAVLEKLVEKLAPLSLFDNRSNRSILFSNLALAAAQKLEMLKENYQEKGDPGVVTAFNHILKEKNITADHLLSKEEIFELASKEATDTDQIDRIARRVLEEQEIMRFVKTYHNNAEYRLFKIAQPLSQLSETLEKELKKSSLNTSEEKCRRDQLNATHTMKACLDQTNSAQKSLEKIKVLYNDRNSLLKKNPIPILKKILHLLGNLLEIKKIQHPTANTTKKLHKEMSNRLFQPKRAPSHRVIKQSSPTRLNNKKPGIN